MNIYVSYCILVCYLNVLYFSGKGTIQNFTISSTAVYYYVLNIQNLLIFSLISLQDYGKL